MASLCRLSFKKGKQICNYSLFINAFSSFKEKSDFEPLLRTHERAETKAGKTESNSLSDSVSRRGRTAQQRQKRQYSTVKEIFRINQHKPLLRRKTIQYTSVSYRGQKIIQSERES